MNYAPDPEHPLSTACPYFPPEDQDWLHGELTAILNGKLAMGPRVARFEEQFAAYCGARHGVAFPSCTAALEAALIALGTKPGDEILVPAQTFVATGMAAHLVGAIPVFTEVSSDTFSMDFEDAWSRVTERTRGAIVVHYGGFIDAGFPAFAERLRASGRFVIEDAAHAHGAELNGKRAGSLADASCFSFYPTKIMTTGEGGMLTTSRPEVARIARSLQNRGRDMGQEDEQYALPGRNNRFTEIAASMGLSQLRRLPEFLSARRHTAGIYDARLREDRDLRPLLPDAGCLPSYWRYAIIPKTPIDRQELQRALAEDRIAIDWAYDPPVHLQPVFRRLLDTRPGMLPRTERLLSRHFCLPIHARLREEDAHYVLDRLLTHIARITPREEAMVAHV